MSRQVPNDPANDTSVVAGSLLGSPGGADSVQLWVEVVEPGRGAWAED